MEALGGPKEEEVVAKANQLWAMLDDMAQSNPEAYRRFMEQQFKDAKEYYAPPEPCLCLKAHKEENTVEKTLFVNICKWTRVPAPPSPSGRVPLSAGKMEEVTDKSGHYSILDIAYNPSVLERGQKDPAEKDRLIHLSLKYIEEHYSLSLSHSYSVLKVKLKGSLERMRQRLRGDQAPSALSQKSTKTEVTLNQLRNTLEKESSDVPLLMSQESLPTKTCLIEEISSTESPLRTPAYEVTTTKDINGKPLKVELKVELPEMCCISECNLSVSKDDVLIECLEKYKLHLELPETVNEEATTATFYKKKGLLVITMPACPSK